MNNEVVAGRPCKNCGVELDGRYCANCGQTADVHVASMFELISNLLGDVFSFDSRLWRSLFPLAFRPGYLTVDYLEGRRARYIPPFRMYLVLSLVFFALNSVRGGGIDIVMNGGDEEVDPQVLEEVQQKLEAARQEFARAAEQLTPKSEVVSPDTQISNPADAPSENSSAAKASESGGCAELADIGPLAWRQSLVDSCNKITADRGEFLLSLRDNVPMMMFLFMPLVALLMKLLYPLERRKYIEHLLFFLHFHAFFFLLVSIGILLEELTELAPFLVSPMRILVTLGSIYFPVYLFMAMRRVYRQGTVVTSIKLVLLTVGYSATLLVSLLLTAGHTAINL